VAMTPQEAQAAKKDGDRLVKKTSHGFLARLL